MGVGAVFVFLPAAILGGIGSELGTAGTIVSALIGAAAGLLFYKLTMMLIARRQTPELAVRGFAGEMLLGLAIGTGVIGTSFLTGDDFGTEGSIVPVFPGLSLAVFMLTAAHCGRKKHPPRRPDTEQTNFERSLLFRPACPRGVARTPATGRPGVKSAAACHDRG